MNAFTLILGSILTVAVIVGGCYNRLLISSTRMDWNHLSIGAVAPLFLIAVFVARRVKITRGEMLVIFTMTLIAGTIPTYFIARGMAWMALPYYGASPENQWAEYYGDHLPSFAIIQPGDALNWYYEGLPPGMSIPWGHWIEPLFWWGTVAAAFYCCCLCLTVMFRKQWVEHERLRYPLMEASLALTDTDESRTFHVAIMNSRLFWAGFAISFGIIAWNALLWFDVRVPSIPSVIGHIRFGRSFEPMEIRVLPLVLGFTYFVNQDIAFSLWFFNLLANLELGVISRFGLAANSPPFIFGSSDMTALGSSQIEGAFIALVLFSIWNARHHLRDVVRKALGKAPEVDDRSEIMSYRSAFFGLLLGVGYLCLWVWKLGMPVPYVPIFMFGVLVLFLGMTRVIAESGLVSIRSPLSPQDLTMFVMGTSGVTNQGLLGVILSFIWCGDTKSTVMPALANSSKLYSTIETDRRRLLWPVLTAMVVGVVSAWITTLHIRYTHGGLKTRGFRDIIWNHFVTKAKNPHGTLWPLMIFIGIGAGLAALFMGLRYRFPLLPFHPVGFAAGAAYPVTSAVASIFVTWLAKVMLRRFGGGKQIERAKPFFVGLILGHFMGAFLGVVVDHIWFPIRGHQIRMGE